MQENGTKDVAASMPLSSATDFKMMDTLGGNLSGLQSTNKGWPDSLAISGEERHPVLSSIIACNSTFPGEKQAN